MNGVRGTRLPAKPGGGKRKNRDTRRQRRHNDALARQARTPAERLDALEACGWGNCHEAVRLRVVIANDAGDRAEVNP